MKILKIKTQQQQITKVMMILSLIKHHPTTLNSRIIWENPEQKVLIYDLVKTF